jgi:putative transposase
MVCGRYIELNPVRAGLVEHPSDYPWSSYQYRALGKMDRLLDDDPWYLGLGIDAEDRQKEYRAWVEARIAEGEWEQIRQATQRGRLIGREAFQKEIQARVGRRLVGESRGRPKKAVPTANEKVL